MQGLKDVIKRLSPHQAALLHMLRRENDVLIVKLYRGLDTKPREPRNMQQYVGAHISHLNASLRRLKVPAVVRPGQTRRTYRLYRVERAKR